MSSVSVFDWLPSILQMIVQAAYVAFLIGALVYAINHRTRYPRPAKYLVWAFSLLLFSNVSRTIFTLAFVNYFPVSQMSTVFAIIQFFSIMATIAALCFVTRAAFIDRHPGANSAGRDFGGRPLVEQPSDNPYAAPRQ